MPLTLLLFPLAFRQLQQDRLLAGFHTAADAAVLEVDGAYQVGAPGLEHQAGLAEGHQGAGAGGVEREGGAAEVELVGDAGQQGDRRGDDGRRPGRRLHPPQQRRGMSLLRWRS